MNDEYFDVFFIDISPGAKPSMSSVAMVFNLFNLVSSIHNPCYLLTGISVSFFSNNGKHSLIK